MTTAAATAPSARTPAYSWFVLGMLCFVYIFNFMDRQLMSQLSQYIKDDLKLTDTQIGLMTGTLFALFYTILGVAAGWLADRSVRTWILGAGCFVWSLFTLLCGKATTFPVMAAARMGVGVGEACGAPPSYSIVSDYFPAERRGQALAIFSLGVPFGTAIGAYLGPTIAEASGWRSAFISIGIAGMIASVLLVLTVREPKKGASDVALDVNMEEAPAAVHAPTPFSKSLNQFFGRPMLVAVAISCALAALVGYSVLQWTVGFMQRTYGKTEWATMTKQYALMIGISMGLGTWLSGRVVDWLAKKSKLYYAYLPAAAFALSMPFWVGFVWAPTMYGKLAFLAVPTFLNIFYLAPALAIVQNSVGAKQRTIFGAMLLLVLNLIGLGGGPTMIGVLSDHFNASNLTAASLTPELCKTAVDAAKATCASASASGLQLALYWLTPFYVLVVVAHLISSRFIKNEVVNGPPSDEAMMRSAKKTKLIAGFGGILIVLIAERVVTGQVGGLDIKAITSVAGGEALTGPILNGLIRDLIMLLMAIVAVMGLGDVFKKKA